MSQKRNSEQRLTASQPPNLGQHIVELLKAAKLVDLMLYESALETMREQFCAEPIAAIKTYTATHESYAAKQAEKVLLENDLEADELEMSLLDAAVK